MILLWKTHLAEMLKQEMILKTLMADKERYIHFLTEENKRLQARLERFEALFFGRAKSAVPQDKKQPEAAPAGETSWQSYLNKHIAEVEETERKAKEGTNDGVSNKGRQAVVHESGRGEAVRPNGGTEAVKPQP